MSVGGLLWILRAWPSAARPGSEGSGLWGVGCAVLAGPRHPTRTPATISVRTCTTLAPLTGTRNNMSTNVSTIICPNTSHTAQDWAPQGRVGAAEAGHPFFFGVGGPYPDRFHIVSWKSTTKKLYAFPSVFSTNGVLH